MKFRSIVAAVTLALVSSTAFAFSCPKHMKAIDAALPTAKLSDAQMADVKKYRADGENLHKEGKHSESLEALGKAEKILGIKM
jgi:Skp family chaperone for outer membrane proteins